MAEVNRSENTSPSAERSGAPDNTRTKSANVRNGSKSRPKTLMSRMGGKRTLRKAAEIEPTAGRALP